MKSLIEAALGNRVFPNLLMVALLLAGAVAMTDLTVRNFPDIDTGTIRVSVAFPGATPQEVSEGIIQPIENAIRSIGGVRRIEARASQGLGVVTVSARRGSDIRSVRDDVETAVNGIAVFPDTAEAPTIVRVEPRELASSSWPAISTPRC